jgi:hypothetical protein
MNVFERALTPETYTNALKNPGEAAKNIASDPGFGLVAGALLGMPEFGGFSALQAGLMTGGISALATGSLQKGLMSGLSAYGGAGLGEAFSKAGETALMPATGGGAASDVMMQQNAALKQFQNQGALDKISAGFGSVVSSPDTALQFAKDNYGKALMAAGPLLADKMVTTKTPLPTAGSLAGPSYIRPYQMTRTVRQPQAGIGSREQNWFDTSWEAGAPYKAANGGIVALAGGGMTSQDAYDFLMGKSSAPSIDTTTKAPTFEGHYEFDAATGTSRWVPARVDMTPIKKPIVPITKPVVTPTTDVGGIPSLIKAGGDPTGANQAKINAFFDNMTPEQQADHQAQLAMIDKGLTPLVKKIKDAILYKDPSEPPAPVVNMDTLSPAAKAEQGEPNGVVTVEEGTVNNSDTNVTPPNLTITPDSNNNNAPGDGNGAGGGEGIGSDGSVGSGMGTTPASGPGGFGASVGSVGGDGGGGSSGSVGSGMGTTSASGPGGFGASVGSVGGAGAGSGSGPGAPGLGTSSGGGFGVTGPGGTAGVGGGGGGGGGGCCFIMLEARYGDGTMDRVVRRYRDEKVTERNKRGYYKLAEVFIPLMRKSKLFSFFVVKTFADPAVCYAKWYYGENKWGWVFKPLERFWMGLFDTLGTETKFIRENGEVV